MARVRRKRTVYSLQKRNTILAAAEKKGSPPCRSSSASASLGDVLFVAPQVPWRQHDVGGARSPRRWRSRTAGALRGAGRGAEHPPRDRAHRVSSYLDTVFRSRGRCPKSLTRRRPSPPPIESPSLSAPHPPRWVWAALIALAALASVYRGDDNDYWFHLAAGRSIVEHGLPAHESWCLAARGQAPWLSEWLFHVALYEVHRWGGDLGVALWARRLDRGGHGARGARVLFLLEAASWAPPPSCCW